MDVLDAALFADNHDAMLHVAFDPFPGGEFKFLSSVEYFKEISPTIDLDGSSELIMDFSKINFSQKCGTYSPPGRLRKIQLRPPRLMQR